MNSFTPTVKALVAIFFTALLLSFSLNVRAKSQAKDSGIFEVETVSVESLGALNGVPYERVIGVVHGKLALSEDVLGLGDQPQNSEGFVEWASEFELLRPSSGSSFRTVVVEAENRGSPLMIQLLNRFLGGSGAPSSATYPPGLGDAFLFDGDRAYARVQWQTGISSGVPSDAQGVGLAALRDFGRLLRDGSTVEGVSSGLGKYENRILVGWSQGAWMVNTVIAEGFNVDPQYRGRGVYGGAVALTGAGNWLAINNLANDGLPQEPYIRPDAAPLIPAEILSRPATDPVFVDIATYTDFYRLRAGVSGASPPARERAYRRYEWPAAHGPAFFVTDALVFGLLGCNSGNVVALNPLDFRPYLRAALERLDEELSAPGRNDRLPASLRFALGPEPAFSQLFNGLPDRPVPVPLADLDGQPVGGVRYPDVVFPLGRLEPVALPPVSTVSINALCGNIGGYTPFTPESIEARYGAVDSYEQAVEGQIDELIRGGYILPRDKSWMLTTASEAYLSATTH